MIRVKFFFRKPLPGYFSIEELFTQVIRYMHDSILTESIYMPFRSCGFFKRSLNILYAATHQGDINHITGDIHYVGILLRKKNTILTIHDLEILRRNHFLKRTLIFFFWYWLPVKRAACITVISEFTRTEL